MRIMISKENESEDNVNDINISSITKEHGSEMDMLEDFYSTFIEDSLSEDRP